MTDDEVRGYLEDSGFPRHVVKAGKDGLVARWRQFVEEVERGYPYNFEDYRNDLDGRAVIHVVGADADVEEYDERLRAMLTATDTRIWESAAGEPFWDFGYPRNARGDLKRGLEALGFWEK